MVLATSTCVWERLSIRDNRGKNAAPTNWLLSLIPTLCLGTDGDGALCALVKQAGHEVVVWAD